MGLDGVFTDEQAVSDFAVGKTGGDQAEDFEFTGRDGQFGEAGRVGGEGRGGGPGRMRSERLRFATGDGETEPDAECGEDGGDESAVILEGMLEDEEAVLGEFENGDEHTADEAVKKDAKERTATRRTGKVGTSRHWGMMIAEKERLRARGRESGRENEEGSLTSEATFGMTDLCEERTEAGCGA